MQHILFRWVTPTRKTNIQEGLQATGCQVYPSRKSSFFIALQRSPCCWRTIMEKKQNLYRQLREHTKQLRMSKSTWLFQLVTAYSAPYFPPKIQYLYDQKLSEIDSRHLNQGEAEKQLHWKKNSHRWTHENTELLTPDRNHLAHGRFTACPVFKVQWGFKNWRRVGSLLCVFWKPSKRTRNITWMTKTELSSYTQKGERFAFELLYTDKRQFF